MRDLTGSLWTGLGGREKWDKAGVPLNSHVADFFPHPKAAPESLNPFERAGRRPVRTAKPEERVYLHRIQLLNTPLPAKYCPAGTMTVEGFISSDSTLKIELLYSFAMKSKALYS